MKDVRERKFYAAVSIIQNLPKSGPIQTPLSTMLQFYALYKQATEGPNSTPKPAFWDIVRKTKWDAWTKLGDLSKTDAMQRYIDEFVSIVNKTTLGGDVEAMIKSLGTLYEAVNNEDIDLLLGPTMDRLFANAGSKKMVKLKEQILKSRTVSQSEIDGGGRHESAQSEYYVAAPSHKDALLSQSAVSGRHSPDSARNLLSTRDQSDVASNRLSDPQSKDLPASYQLRTGGGAVINGELRNGAFDGHGGVTTWSQCVQSADSHHKDLDICHQYITAHTSSAPSSASNSQLVRHQEFFPSADSSQELGAVSEAVLNIEQELTNVADKLNSISKLYKKTQWGDRISIPTLGLILVWPVLTQFVFMWYASRSRQMQQSR